MGSPGDDHELTTSSTTPTRAIYADADSDAVATDPLTPLSSGPPFFHGNVLNPARLRNGRPLQRRLHGDPNSTPIFNIGTGNQQPVGGLLGAQDNLTNNSVWDQTDITYLLRGTIVPQSDPNYAQLIPPTTGTGAITSPPALTSEVTPYITLTIQSALPGTLLADGSSIAKPGASVIIKTLGAAPGSAATGELGLGVTASSNAGAGFEFGYDNGVDPPSDPYIDQGLNDSLRILGIGGNETTGQSRVPVIITSVHDSSVGPLVRGVNQSQVIPNDAVALQARRRQRPIVFGGNITNDYNAFLYRSAKATGSTTSTSASSRIEMQGGGDMVDPWAPRRPPALARMPPGPAPWARCPTASRTRTTAITKTTCRSS